MTTIRHTEGYKDEYLVEVENFSPLWHPTNEEIFTLIDMWFESEDYEFGDGYGRAMPLFYLCLIAIGESEVAFDAYGKCSSEAVQHFETALEEHRDEVIAYIEDI